MIEIVIENQGVNEILPMVTSMRDRGWVLNRDFSFAYYNATYNNDEYEAETHCVYILSWRIGYLVYIDLLMNELYNSHEQRLDTVMGGAHFWAAMRQCRDSEGRDYCQTNLSTFQWFRDTYGIELQLSSEYNDNIKPEVRIVDEQKYLIFLLKYSKGNI